MSLLSAINIGAQALDANQIGMRVVANNIANANTPGYIRQTLNLGTAVSQKVGNLNVGLGVRTLGVQQHVDLFVASRLRDAKSDLEAGTQQRDVLQELEGVLGELNDTDLSTGLTRFFSSINDIVNQPESASVRNVAILEAKRLTSDIRSVAGQLREMRTQVNDQVKGEVDEVNRLLDEIAKLNVKILQTEGGNAAGNAAVGLRDQRLLALERLSELMDVKATEQESGTISVYAGGDFLVFDGTARSISIETESNRGIAINRLVLTETGSTLRPEGGVIGGLLASRDETLAEAIDRFDQFARTLAYEFNRVHSSSQGLVGFGSITSVERVSSIDAPLDEAGLSYVPENGSFSVLVRDVASGQTRTIEIPVSLQGLDDDTTLADIRDALDAVDGLSASIDSNRRLRISTEREGLDFAFADDTSGLLASLGIGTFFTGTGAGDIDIGSELLADPRRFAASQEGIGTDARGAEALASLGDRPIDSLGGLAITQVYERLTIQITQASASAAAEVDGLTVYKNTIEAQHLSVTGVSLDEEAIRLMTYQRAFQASARVIQTASDLFEVLVNL